MNNHYRNNHYVPIWYQKRFLPQDQIDQELFYLHLKPRTFVDPRGVTHVRRAVQKLGFKFCFAEKDLYTTKFGNEIHTAIEQEFFGDIDRKARDAVEHFTNFDHTSINKQALQDLLIYMSSQKLRTPKGLDWLSASTGATRSNAILRTMIRLRNLYCAIWSECIWQIADAANSQTKFIVSDHPVTVYNRSCGPRSEYCKNFNDPDIRFNASHTIFPLSLEKVLILTNLSWVRNPSPKRERKLRPHPDFFRGSLFNFTDIQIQRELNEQEVLEINFILKKRAYSFIGAAKEEWLYPEKHISVSNWYTFGEGYLLMPDPRAVHAGGEVFWGSDNGPGGAIDSYGRRPWQADYAVENRNHNEFHTLHKFQGKFAKMFGAKRRGRSFHIGELDPEFDSEQLHKYHLSLIERKK